MFEDHCGQVCPQVTLEEHVPRTGREWADVTCDLEWLQAVEVEQDRRRFRLRSEVQRRCGTVFQAAGVAIPPTVRHVEPVTPGEAAAQSHAPGLMG
jgi:hypothetical protein